MTKRDIVIIGGGPAGMAAAVEAFDNGIKNIVIIDREDNLGGILCQCIHNGFGLHKLGEELTGPEYAHHYAKMVSERKIEVMTSTTVLKILDDNTVVATNKDGIVKISAKAVILAMGCRERSRGALNIPGTRPAGVYSAGTAQKLMNCEGFKVGERVVILGSGDIGLIMARRMTLEGAKVEAVCELMSYSGGLARNIVQCLDDYGIPLYLSTTVVKVHGRERVEGVTVAKVDERGRAITDTERFIPCDTLLLSVGLIPENELTYDADISLSQITGGALVDENRMTEREGVFACGNVLHVHDLVDYVSAEAEIAGRSAAEYVKGNLKRHESVNVKAGEGVRYVLPQKIDADGEREVSLFMRVSSPVKDCVLKVLSKGELIKQVKKIKCAPGEMEKITLTPKDRALISGDVEVVLEGRE